MAKEEKIAPKLRFNGYTDDWEHVKPKKYLKISKVPGSNGLIAKKLTVKLWGKGVVEKDTTFNGSENTKYFTRKSGQLMYGKLDFLHAAFGIVPQNLNNYESTADSPAFDINDVGDRTFLINYFLRPEFYLKNGEKANGSRKAKRIHEETFLNMPMQAPIKSEQEKIAKTLNSLNNTIQLHERKCEELTLIKRALLQNLFPKKDEFKPEVRYKNFSDAWEQRKFFDNIEKVIDFRGRTPKKLGMKWSNEGYVALSALNVKDGYIDFTADVHYANKDLYDKWMVGNDLYKGQVLFTTEAPMGNVAQIPDNQKYVLSQRTIAFDVFRNKITNDFLAVLLRSQNVQHKLKSLASGGTAQGVSQKSLSQLKVTVPTRINEQQKIGEFFKQLDSLIALHQRKLEKLKQLKKFLLQNMFI